MNSTTALSLILSDNCPNEISISDSLYISDHFIPKLPDTLNINGHLYFFNSIINTPPNNLSIQNSLIIDTTNFHHLPTNLFIGNSLILYNSDIKKLPITMSVKNEIFIDEFLLLQCPYNDLEAYLSLYGNKLHCYDNKSQEPSKALAWNIILNRIKKHK